jgi:hypothetical protein
MRNRATQVAVFLLWNASVALAASDPPSLKGQYDSLTREYANANTAFRKALDTAKSEQDAMKVLENNPRVEFAKRFLHLAEQDAKDPVAIDSLIWIIENGGEDSPEIRQALRYLAERHATSEKIEPLTLRMSNYPFPEREPFLRAALERAPHTNVQGKACLGLARLLKSKSQVIRFCREREKTNSKLPQALADRFGRDYAKQLLASDVDQIDREAEKLFERAISQYGHVALRDRPVGDAANADLFEMRQLSVGHAAPEIEGEDIDGERFKLSDYRGKVVVLDFWGHW